jgi:outer membrane protein assembly factor BamB
MKRAWPAVALLTSCGTALYVTASAQVAGRAALEWPGWRGAQRDAVSPDTALLKSWKPGGPALVFKATGLGTGYSSVAVAGGRIYTLGDKDGSQHLFALDAKDGKSLWTAKVGAPWVDQMGGPRGTPTVDGGSVYAVGTDGDVVCVDAATGKERWRRSLENYSSVVISNGAGVKQYVQLMGRGLVGVRASDGKLLWSYNRVANDVANISTPVVKGDYVFASTGYQTGTVLLKLEPSAGGVAAKEVYFLDPKTFQNHHGGFVLVGDHIYGGHGHNKGFPICIEMATGKVVWGGDTRNAGTGSAAVVYADGNLYFRYQNGLVVLIEATPAGYSEKGSLPIPDVANPSWPHPVVVGGRLYLREQDNLFVYDVKA